MLLRLFKDPYSEPFSPGRTRLLFEQAPDETSVAPGRKDFYLYVWIQDSQQLAGFQAVLDDELVADFRPPRRLDFSRISGKPLKRSLREPLDASERRAFLADTRGLWSASFGNLVHTVDSILHGDPAASLELTPEERTTLAGLVWPASNGKA
jgi:hypothetical protein